MENEVLLLSGTIEFAVFLANRLDGRGNRVIVRNVELLSLDASFHASFFELLHCFGCIFDVSTRQDVGRSG